MLTREQIEHSFPAGLTSRAEKLWQSGAVDILDQYADDALLHIEAIVRERLTEYDISFRIDGKRGSVSSYCDCEGGASCVHLVAALFALSAEADAQASLPADTGLRHTARILARLTVPQMRQVAKRHGWKLKGTAKAEITRHMAERLHAALAAGSLLAELSPQQARLLAAVQMVHGWENGVDSAEITHLYRNLLGEKSKPDRLLTGLFEHGLLARERHDGVTYYIGTLDMTAHQIDYASLSDPVLDIKLLPAKRFARSTPRLPQAPIQYAAMQLGQATSNNDVVPAAQSWDAPTRSLDADLLDDWPITALEARTLTGTNSHRFMFQERQLAFPLQMRVLGGSSAEMLTNILGSVDKADWLFELLSNEADSLFVRQKDGRYALNGEAWLTFQSLPEPLQIRRLFALWTERAVSQHELRKLLRDYPDWSLWRLVAPGLTYDYFGRNIDAAHRAVLRFLGQLAVQTQGRDSDWVQLDQFIKIIGQRKPHLYQTVSGVMTWGFRYKGKPVNNEGNRRWANTYGELVRNLFDGPLYWFGVVELMERAGRIDAFRITDLGRWLLAPATAAIDEFVAADAQQPSVLTWQEDDSLLIERGYDIGTKLAVVNRFMHADMARPGHYLLDSARLEDAFASGELPTSIEEEFMAIKATLPESIRAKVNRFHANYGHVHLYENLTVIELGDEFALAELRAAGVIEPDDIVYEFSPKLVVINESAADRIIKAMQKKQYTPRVIEAK